MLLMLISLNAIAQDSVMLYGRYDNPVSKKTEDVFIEQTKNEICIYYHDSTNACYVRGERTDFNNKTMISFKEDIVGGYLLYTVTRNKKRIAKKVLLHTPDDQEKLFYHIRIAEFKSDPFYYEYNYE
jgi:hypothetical protein